MTNGEATGDGRDAASVDVTVVIPTLNGEQYLAEVLDAVAAQRFDGAVETLVIDSGSTDSTLEIVRARPHVRLHAIPNVEFGHGRTRNLGARLARGRIVAYLTQDATPADDGWLAALVAPLAQGTAEAVVGRQIPRRTAFPLQKYDIERVFESLGPVDEVSVVGGGILDDLDAAHADAAGFYSDVNSATHRAFLVDTIPYRDVAYSEDLLFARDVLEAGYRKAYAPRGAVRHSNEVGVREYAARMFDEAIGLRRIGHPVRRHSWVGAMLRAVKGALADTARILRDPDYRLGERLRWLVVNPAYHLARWYGLYHGGRADLDDARAVARRSWEARQRGAAGR
ncbi:glycosyltransferase family 2 protein [Agromyces bauzanensis]